MRWVGWQSWLLLDDLDHGAYGYYFCAGSRLILKNLLTPGGESPFEQHSIHAFGARLKRTQ